MECGLKSEKAGNGSRRGEKRQRGRDYKKGRGSKILGEEEKGEEWERLGRVLGNKKREEGEK